MKIDKSFALTEPNRCRDYHKTELPELSARARITPAHIWNPKFPSF